MSSTVYVGNVKNEIESAETNNSKESCDSVAQAKSLTMERLKEIITAWPHDDAPLL
jgi:hypothetical protein